MQCSPPPKLTAATKIVVHARMLYKVGVKTIINILKMLAVSGETSALCFPPIAQFHVCLWCYLANSDKITKDNMP